MGGKIAKVTGVDHVSASSSRRTAMVIWLAILLALVVWIEFGRAALDASAGSDLASVYFAARFYAEGRLDLIYQFDPQDFRLVSSQAWEAARARFGYTGEGVMHPFVQPPLVAAAFAPIAERLDFHEFRSALLILEQVAFALCVCVAYAAWRPMTSRPLHFCITLVILSASYPFISSMLLGQTQPFVILLTLLALERDHANWPILAALALALAVALKVSPGVLAAYWLIFGRWRTLAAFCVFLAVYAGLTAALVDAHLIDAFLSRMRDINASVIVGYENVSLQAFLHHVFEDGEFGYLIAPRPAWIGFAAHVFLAAIILVAWLRGRNADATWRIRAAAPAIVIAGIVAAPLAWHHYFSFVLIYAPTIAALWPRWRGVALAIAIVTATTLFTLWIAPLVKGAPEVLTFLTLGAGLLAIAAALFSPRGGRAEQADPGLPPGAAQL